MTIAVIGCLAVVAICLGKAWTDARAENTELRNHIASLKRQLAKRRSRD